MSHPYDARGVRQRVSEARPAPRPDQGRTEIGSSNTRCRLGEAVRVGATHHGADRTYKLGLPRLIRGWTPTTPREKWIKIGAKVVRHSKYVLLQLAEVTVPR